MKKLWLLCLFCLVLPLGIASAQDMMTEVGAGEGRLDIIAWPGYIERGETDPAFDWVTEYEANTGCMVNIKTAATSDE